MLLSFVYTGLSGGSPPAVAAATNAALLFNGTNQYATLGTASQLRSATFTIELWLKRAAGGVTQSTGTGGITAYPLVTKGRAEAETAAADVNYFVGIDATGHLAADFEEAQTGASPSANHPITGTAVIPLGEWHHVAATYDGSTWNLYVDGALDGTLSVGRPANAATNVITALGTSLNTSGTLTPLGFFSGAVDEVRIWNVARTLAQIQAEKNNEFTGTSPDLIARYGLNEGIGTSLGDSSGNNIVGTAVPSATWTTQFAPPPPGNGPPNAPTVNAPSNGATGIGTSPTLDVSVSDPDGDPLTVTFFGRPFASGNYAQIAQNSGVASGANTTTTWTSIGAGQKFQWYVTVADAGNTTTGSTWTFSTAASADPVFVGAGDIADCARTQDEATAAVLSGIQGNVWTAGDNVYPDGHAANFTNCYEPSWGGAIKARTRPVPGNHDWGSASGLNSLTDYFAYYGASATDGNGKSWYSYDIPSSNWHVVNLDTECAEFAGGCAAGGEQELWLRADLAANATRNVITVWHKPRYSSALTTDDELEPLFEDLYQYGVDILLQGHDHVYERFDPITYGANLSDPPVVDPTYGISQFTVGTGGAALQGFGATLPGSVIRNGSTFGVLKLTLHATTYDWKFLPMDGQTFTDAGTASVHPAPPQSHAPVAVDDSYTTPVDATLNIAAPGVLANDADADSDPLTAALVTDVSHGALSLNANGSFNYTPDSGYSGPDSFTYKANDGALDSNVATVAIGVGNSGLQLGTSSYVTFGDPAKLDLPSFTIETWFMRTGPGTPNQSGTGGIPSLLPLVTHGAPQAEGSNVDANWILGIDATGNVIAADFEARDDPAPTGVNVPISGTTTITDNVWHHAAATFDATTTTWSVYLDGNLEASTTANLHPRDDSIQKVALGTMIESDGVTTHGRFEGVIDEARVWDHARSGGEILADKNNELTSGAGLIARWGLNEGTGSNVGDSMTTPANGTIQGTGSSWVAGFVPPAPDLPPDPPANLAATASRAGIALSWDANVESDLAGYNVYRSTAPGFTIGTPINSALVSGTTYLDSDVTDGVTYYYVVTAVDSGGHESTPSNEDSATGIGSGLKLGSSGAYVTFGDPSKLDLAQFTVETWFKRTGTGVASTTGTGGTKPGINMIPLLTHGAAESEGSNVDANWILGIRPDGPTPNVLAADFEDTVDGGNHPISGTTVITNNVWHHAAAAFNGTVWSLYLDGHLEASITPGALPRSDSTQGVGLGAMIPSGGTPTAGRFDGVLDEARVWNVAHDATQIAATMGLEISSGGTLKARWGMNEAGGGTVGDSMAPAADGTISGSGTTWVAGAPVTPGAGNQQPNAPSVNAPANGATGIGTSTTLDVSVSDPDLDSMTVTLYGRPLASGNFVQIGQSTGVASGSNATASWTGLRAGQSYEWYATADDGTSTRTGQTWTFHTVASADPVFVGAGDIASCAVTEDTDTGNIVAGIDGTVWTTGDNVYDNGLASEFTNCYATTPWGTPAVKDRTRPVTGNHDWGLGNTDSLAGYNGYFGAAATDGNGKSYYSYDIPNSNWHIVNLDTECALVGGCNAGSPQELWLVDDLAANATKNVIAEWHRPRWSSGTTTTTALQPLWDDLYAAGVDLLLDGHDHIYERTAPMKAGPTLASPPVADPTYGIRQFTVGTGGEGHHGLTTALPTSEVRNASTFGVLKLTLHDTTYDWVFLPIAGSTFTDAGTGSVHGAPPGNHTPDLPTVNSPTNGATGVNLSPTLNVGVSDADGDTLTVTFFGRPLASGNFTQIGTANSGVPSGTNTTKAWANLGAGQSYEWYATVNDGTTTRTGPTWTFHTIASTDPVFVGVGDIASCAVTEDTATGNLIAGIDGAIWTTGDNVYDNGLASEFTNCYATTPWGTPGIKNRTRPLPGNHDWGLGTTNSLAGYFGYYGAAANAGGTSYYSYDIPNSNWHIVNLDTECALVGGCNSGSPQELWLKADLTANASKNVIAAWHRPRWSSGTTTTTALQPLWDDLYAAGVDLLLDGHDHIYERTAPMRSGDTLSSPPVADPTYGIRQFTVGTGGEGHHGLTTPLPTSQVRNDQTFGVLKLTLHATTYDWAFLPIVGSTFTDAGTGSVHGAPPPPTTIGFRSAASATNATTTTLVLPRPAGVISGDVLLATVSVRGTPTIAPPAGWTLVRSDPRSTTFTQAVYVHAAGGAEPSSYTFTFGGSFTAVGTVAAYTGVDTANPVAGNSGQANSGSTSITAPSLTTSVTGTRLVAMFGITGNTTIGPANGMTERVEAVSPAGVASKLTLALDDQSNAPSGATGTRIATAADSGNSIGQLVALRAGTGGPPPNTIPTANAVSATTPLGTAVDVTLAGSDVETCQLTFSIVTGPSHGTLGGITPVTCVAGTPNQDTATVQYTPTAGYTGPDSFTYRVFDGTDFSSSATASLSVTPPANTAPTATDLNVGTAQDTPVNVTLAGSDVETCELAFSIVGAPTHGALGTIGGALCAPGSPNVDAATVQYTPNAGYSGPDSFTYRVSDGTTFSSTATVTMTVTPASSGITFRAAASGANTGTTSLVLPRPTGTLSGDVLVAGVIVRGAPSITPPAGWSQVRREVRGSTFSQALYVHVAGASEPTGYTWTFSAAGTAVGDVAAYSGVDTSQPVAANAGQVNASSTSIVAASLTTSVANTRLIGFFGIAGKPTISPPPTMIERQEIVTANGTGSKLTMELSDQTLAAAGASGTRTATASSSAVNIGQLMALRPAGGPPPPNQPPNAVADSFATVQDSVLVLAAPGVLGNDTDADGDNLNAVLDANVIHGTLALGADGGFTYTPISGYTGPDSFAYHASDGSDDSATVVVSLTITATGTGVAFHGAASGANTGTASLALARPSGTVPGDVLVAGISVRGTPTVTPPAGWSLVRSDPRGSTFSQAVYVHVAGASEPASYTWSFSAASTAVGILASYGGVDTSQPIAADAGQANTGAAIVAPSVTPGVPNTRLVGLFGIVGKRTVTPPATMVERVEILSGSGTSAKLALELSDEALAASGATGTRTATASASAANIGQLVALRPAP